MPRDMHGARVADILTPVYVCVMLLRMATTQITDDQTLSGPMSDLLKEHEDLAHVPKLGEIITGTILEKASNSLYVDLGSIGVGVVYGRELFDDIDSFKHSKIGDTIQATIQELDNEDGYIELSLRSASRERSWEELRRKMSQDEIFETEILDANKGGLIIRMSGITGFLPVSQLAPDHYPRVEGGDRTKIFDRLNQYVGEKFRVKIISAVQDEEKLIVSEKAAVGEEMRDVLGKLGEGTIIEGSVSGVVDFGVFVKFQVDDKDLEGLVHISELAWQRVDNPADLVKVGDSVKAKVIGVDQGLRISLSLKQMTPDPWLKVGEKFKLGDKVTGEIFKVTQFGGFVKLDEDIHGLIHVSELPEGSQQDLASVLKIGEKKEFTIISLEPEEHRLGLSLRTNPEFKQRTKKKIISEEPAVTEEKISTTPDGTEEKDSEKAEEKKPKAKKTVKKKKPEEKTAE